MKKTLYLILVTCIMVTSVVAQTPVNKFTSFQKKGIIRKLSDLRATASARTAQKRKPDSAMLAPMKFRLDVAKKFKFRLGTEARNRGFDFEREGPGDEGGADNRAIAAVAPSSTEQVWSNFLATTFGEFPSGWPPDPSGAIGTSQIVVSTNGGIKVFEKRAVTESPLVSYKGSHKTPEAGTFSMPLDQFFSPVLPSTSFISDPHVRYDRLSKHWFIVAIEINQTFADNSILLAVSDGERITDASNFIYYSFPSAVFQYNHDDPNAPFLDYPTLGIDAKNVLIGGNAFFYDSLNCVGYALDKKGLLHGELFGYALKLGSYNPDQNTASGLLTPQGVQNDDPAASKSFFAGISFYQQGINLAALTYANGYLTNVTETDVKTDPYQFARDITALGSPMPIDPLDTRLFAAAIHKNKLTGKSSLWTAHAIGINQSGTYVPDSVFTDQARTGSRWYEINNLYSKPHLQQFGTLYDEATKSGRRATFYFNPSVAANGQGHTLLGGTTSAYNHYLNTFVAGRNYMDAPGTLGTPQRTTATTGIYAAAINFGTSYYYIGRWGDFSQSDVDPQDDQTLWTFQEYCNADDDYGVRAIQVKAPAPATPLAPDAISNSDNVWVTVKGTSENGSGFFDPGADKGGPGYNRLSVKLSGGLIATVVKFVSPTEVRFYVNAKGKPAGTYTVVITNPDGQVVTTNLKITSAMATTSAATIDRKEIQKFSSGSAALPNPTSGKFMLQVTAAKNWTARVVLTDADGKQVAESRHTFTKGNNEISLSVAAYGNGTYLASVYNEKGVLITTQKIIKQ